MNIKYFAMLIISILCLTACSEKGNMDVAKAAAERKDYPAAIKEYTLLAEDGDAEAQYQLGWLYFSTQATRSEYRAAYAQAVKWYRKAADQGHMLAQLRLGQLYNQGLGVHEDHVKARYWYLKAADQGDVVSIGRLGDMYRYSSTGAKKDVIVALALFHIVMAKSGTSSEIEKTQSSDSYLSDIEKTQSSARYGLEDLTAKMMSPDDVEAGNALADRMTAPGAVLSDVLAQYLKQ